MLIDCSATHCRLQLAVRCGCHFIVGSGVCGKLRSNFLDSQQRSLQLPHLYRTTHTTSAASATPTSSQGPTTNMDDAVEEMTRQDVWDDSALVQSWNEALAEYKVSTHHSTTAKCSQEKHLDIPVPEISQHTRHRTPLRKSPVRVCLHQCFLPLSH